MLDIFKKRGRFDLAAVVQQMFDEAGITPQRPDDKVFMTVIDGVHCSFETILKLDEKRPHRLFIYAQFPIPVPEHVAGLMSLEINRLNAGKRYRSEIAIRENGDGHAVFAFTVREFKEVPAPDEIKALMTHTVDVMDDGNFRSLMCAIMGYDTYDRLEEVMMGNAQVEGSEAVIQMSDGYRALDGRSDGVTSSRYGGRLLMLATHVIESRISQGRARQLLDRQTPLPKIVQEAYNAASDLERDILRKLWYLVSNKKTEPGDDGDSMLGRLEAMSLIAKDIRLLLDGTE